MINDSLGNEYLIHSGFELQSKKSMTINIPKIPTYGTIQIYASTGTDDLNVYIANIDTKVKIMYLLGTDPQCMSFNTSISRDLFNYEDIYENTTYRVTGNQLLTSGKSFPDKILFYNNTNSTVLTNTNNTNGTNPNIDKLTITSFYIMDSEDNVYADYDEKDNISFIPGNKSNKSRIVIGHRPILIQLDKKIKNGETLQIYIETSDDDFTIVLLNHNNKVVVLYPCNIDPTAFVLMLKENDIREPCKTIDVKNNVNAFGAVFDSTSIWKTNQLDPSLYPGTMGTLKVGFIGGSLWKKAWIAKIIDSSISPIVNIDFKYVFDENVDSSYHIRISFDPALGCYSLVGNQSKNNSSQASMNFGWMDAPLNTTFYYKNVSYKTDTTFDQGGYPGTGTTIIHEFCHALGMLHEHQNPYGLPWNWNRSEVYKYFGGPPNNWSKDDIDTQILKSLNSNTTNGSQFDFNSIMRYNFPTHLLQDATNYASISTPNLILSGCDQYWLNKNYPGKIIYPNDPVCNVNPITVSPPEPPLIISNQPSVDCAVSEWGPWSSCTSTCGGGTQKQTRTIVTRPIGTGLACPALSQTQLCNTQSCSFNVIPFSTISVRQQWLANYGYCGETSFITSAMYYGMYMSQYDVRYYTSVSQNQNKENDQVLIGTPSEVAAANLFKLNYKRWSDTSEPRTTSNFVNWMERHTRLKHPVISVVFENKDFVAIPGGQAEYDHIISIIDVDVSGNSITLCDNGIVTPENREMTFNKSTTPMIFTYDLSTFIRNRADSLLSVSEYSLPNILPTYTNVGIAITGVNSSEPSLVRIQLTSPDMENTPMVNGSNIRPASNPMTLTIHLYALQANKTYHLYRYKNPLVVPTHNFNATYTQNSTSGDILIDIINTNSSPPIDTIMTKVIQSNEIAIFRCVLSTAP